MNATVSLSSSAADRHTVQEATAKHVDAWADEGQVKLAIQTVPCRDTLGVGYNVILTLPVDHVAIAQLKEAIPAAEEYVSPIEAAKRLLQENGYRVVSDETVSAAFDATVKAS